MIANELPDITLTPTISVIIPTYNRSRYVLKAIDSVLQQSFAPYEIIVIDDGSTDGTRDALRPYATRTRYIYQENAGVSSARNVGIGQASGEWVAFLDSDDEWKKDYLSTQAAQIREFPFAVAHMTNAVTIHSDGEGKPLFLETGLLGRFRTDHCLVFERPLSVIIRYGPWFLQSSLIRRDVLLKAGLFDAQLSIAEDIDVIARVALQGAFTIRKEELVEVYRRKEPIENLGAQSVKRGIYRYRAFGKVYSNLLRVRELTWAERATIARAQGRNLRSLGNVLVMAGRKSEARQYYKGSLFLYPSFQSLVKLVGTCLPEPISRALVRRGRHILPGESTELEKE